MIRYSEVSLMNVYKSEKLKTFSGYREVFAAVLLVLLVFVLGVFSIDNSCYWGDDFAAYISQGIAMAEGRLEEQAVLNLKMHPSPLPAEAKAGGELIYVWGYPLILSGIYKLVGFDRVDFSSIIFYKLPSVIALALLAAVLFFFYRRRFGFRLSFLLALLFCCCSEMFDFLNTIYSDMVFLLLAMFSLLLCEIFIEKKKAYYAVLLGICLWFMYEVRLNGVSIVLCCVLAQLIAVISIRQAPDKPGIAELLLPYTVFAALIILSRFFMPAATPNTSDIGSGMNAAAFLDNLKTYANLICHWLGLLWNSILINPLYSVLRRFVPVSFESFKMLRDILVGISLVFCALGIIFESKRNNLHLSILVVVYIIIVSSLPYTQGLRYIYPLLPLILMYFGYTIAKIGVIFEKLPRRVYDAGTWILLCVCCLFIIYPHVSAALKNEKGVRELDEISSASDIYMQNAYSEDAIELYRYIQSETDDDAVFAFFAPRALYLNTQRVAVRPGVNEHRIEDADYYLQYLSVGDYPVDQPPDEGFSPCFENSQFVLYEKTRK